MSVILRVSITLFSWFEALYFPFWGLELDMVYSIGDLKALIKEKTPSWWNHEIQDLQIQQIEHYNTDRIQLYCAVKINMYLQNKEDVGKVCTVEIKLNEVTMSIYIEFEANNTLKAQIEHDNTDRIQLYSAVKINLYLQNKEDVGKVCTVEIKLNEVTMLINIEFEANNTLKADPLRKLGVLTVAENE
ncbi:hypothetical protein TSUD_45500 [Trifolium subterraneum]|nr:hypothetical protein TSUD_45500 [Trifolium subterraneum]